MTTKTDITLPPLPGALVDVETEARAYARAAVEADRRDHIGDATGMVPSDEHLIETGCYQTVIERHSQPAASAEPAVWVAADTLNSPHPKCISSLAYMSQIDQDRGREYVPLAVITHKAAPVAQEPMASDIEQMALTRYRPAPDGLLRYKVVAGDGTRALYHGTKDECCTIARKLTEAFLDGAFAAQSAAPVAAQAQRGGNGVVDTHCYKIPG